ncbi:MAG: PIN domain-containing protein [Chloroflexi bacterium]|nr:PIN domain-containing protein [Chloroflexota bacterium]
MSPTGGSRLLFYLGEAGYFRIIAGRSVIQECNDVIIRKAPARLHTLAQLLDATGVKIGENPLDEHTQVAKQLLDYPPDAIVLAKAIQVDPDWFVTHDRKHFLFNPALRYLSFRIGTPGDVIQLHRAL